MHKLSSALLCAPLLLSAACDGNAEFSSAPGVSQLALSGASQPAAIDAMAIAHDPAPALRFSIRDTPTDALPTVIKSLQVHVTSTVDASKLSWGLDSNLGRLIGTVSGELGRQSITFEPAGIQVAEGTELACTLTVQGDPGAGSWDGASFRLEMFGSEQRLASGSSPMASDAHIDNGQGFSYSVRASELRVIEQPPASLRVGESFGLAVAFTDALGHVDADVDSDEVSVARGDNQEAVGLAKAVDGVARFKGEEGLLLQDPPCPSLSLKLLDDPAGAVDFSASAVATAPLSLSADNDRDARIEPSPALVEPLQLDLASLGSNVVDVLDFTIVDGGGGDGESCSVLGLDFALGGTAHAESHRFRLRGPGLDTAIEGRVSGSAGQRLLSFADLPIEVGDGQAATYTLQLELDREQAKAGETLFVSLDSAGVQSWGTIVTSGSVSNAPGLTFTTRVPSLGLSGSLTTPLAGGKVAPLVVDGCSELEVVIGYRSSVKNDGTLLVSSVQTLCGELAVTGSDSYQVKDSAGATLAQRGNTGTSSYEQKCPPDQVVVGLHGGSGGAVDNFGIDCAPVLISAAPLRVSLGQATSLPTQGGAGGSPFTLRCADSSVARGTVTRVRNAQTSFGFVSLEALGLTCGELELH